MADLNYFFVQFVESALGVVCGIGLVLMAFCGVAALIAVWGQKAELNTAALQPLPETSEDECYNPICLFFGF